ncbi:MAG: hypothetical protein V3S72_02725, partial [Desulfobacterales bacterium]
MNHPRLTYHLLICVISLGLVLSPGYAKQEVKKEGQSLDPLRYGGTYRVPLMNNPTTLDPAYV